MWLGLTAGWVNGHLEDDLIHYLVLVLVKDADAPADPPRPDPADDEVAFGGPAGGPPTTPRRNVIRAVTILVTLVFSYIALKGINFKLAWNAILASNPLWIAASLIPWVSGTSRGRSAGARCSPPIAGHPWERPRTR